MSRIFTFIYGAFSYVIFLASFLYAIGFIGNFGVPKSMDTPASGPWQTAYGLISDCCPFFAVEHSVMARPAFKRMLTKATPVAMERSTYVLASSRRSCFCFAVAAVGRDGVECPKRGRHAGALRRLCVRLGACPAGHLRNQPL